MAGSLAGPRKRQEAFTDVARIRSLVSGSVVYGSFGYPQNSEPVALSTTRSLIPETTQAPRAASTVTVVVRTRSPDRANEYPVAPIGVQPCSSTEIRARVIGSCEETKNDPSESANSSGSTAPSSLASAYTLFFCESVGSTLALSPVRCESARSPDSDEDTFQSRITSPPSGAAPRATRTTRTSALPQRKRCEADPGRVAHRVRQRRGDRVERGLAHRLGAERPERIAGRGEVHLCARQVREHRHVVLAQRARGHPSRPVNAYLFEQRGAERLRHPALHLAAQLHRVDDRARVDRLHGLQDADLAGLGADRHPEALHGERDRPGQAVAVPFRFERLLAVRLCGDRLS